MTLSGVEGAGPLAKSRAVFCEGSCGAKRQWVDVMNRLWIAFVVFAVLAGLAWSTLPDERIRAVTLAILGLFAVKTWLHRKELSRPPEE